MFIIFKKGIVTFSKNETMLVVYGYLLFGECIIGFKKNIPLFSVFFLLSAGMYQSIFTYENTWRKLTGRIYVSNSVSINVPNGV